MYLYVKRNLVRCMIGTLQAIGLGVLLISLELHFLDPKWPIALPHTALMMYTRPEQYCRLSVWFRGYYLRQMTRQGAANLCMMQSNSQSCDDAVLFDFRV